MDELKIFGLNIGALLVSVMPNLNPILQTVVLLLTIIYTVLMIIKKAQELKKWNILLNLNLIILKWSN